MLIELWERLRGYDKWVETKATIKTARSGRVVVAEYHSKCGTDEVYSDNTSDLIAWKDAEGQEHTGVFEVTEESPLIDLGQGATVTIRYNPADPEQFYVPDELRSPVARFWKWGIWPTVAILIVPVIFLVAWILGKIALHATSR